MGSGAANFRVLLGGDGMVVVAGVWRKTVMAEAGYKGWMGVTESGDGTYA